MAYKNFRLHVVARVLLLAVTLVLVIFLARQDNLLITSIVLGAIAVFQVVELIHYLEETNRKLTHFFQSTRHSDFSTSFTGSIRGKHSKNLNIEFNEVIQAFQKKQSRKDGRQRNYLLTVVQHVSIGIIAFHGDGSVDIFNNAVKKLLKINNLKNIQASRQH
ncbi:MAG: hypothetical protein U5L09_18900 [Bacteroidales bacterium]|nr:hypothetical protein [Bacteroidales bacterium]